MLKDKHVVITGGGRGIGRVFTQRFLEAGARVTITGRSEDTLAEAARTLEGDLETQAFDVSDIHETTAAFQRIHQARPIDVLVNNAGVLGPIELFWQTQPELWQDAVDTNLKGTAFCTHAALQHMVPQQHGTIINIVSSAGAFRWPTCSAYSVSKAAVIKLTENLAFETRRHRVALFAYHPGLVLSTGLVADTLGGPPTPEDSPLGKVRKWTRVEQLAGRTVDADQSAVNLLKLASGDYGWLSGRYLTVVDSLEALLGERDTIVSEDLLTLRPKQRSA